MLHVCKQLLANNLSFCLPFESSHSRLLVQVIHEYRQLSQNAHYYIPGATHLSNVEGQRRKDVLQLGTDRCFGLPRTMIISESHSVKPESRPVEGCQLCIRTLRRNTEPTAGACRGEALLAQVECDSSLRIEETTTPFPGRPSAPSSSGEARRPCPARRSRQSEARSPGRRPGGPCGRSARRAESSSPRG